MLRIHRCLEAAEWTEPSTGQQDRELLEEVPYSSMDAGPVKRRSQKATAFRRTMSFTHRGRYTVAETVERNRFWPPVDRNSLKLAACYERNTVAFPSISTGIYGFPLEKAAPIAVHTIRSFLKEHPEIEKVQMVCFDEITKKYYENALDG